MVTRAQARYIRISPRKFRQVIPYVAGKKPEDAIAILMNVKKGASVYAIELLKSAIANAKRMQGVDVSGLYISKMVADCGPMLKRFRAGSMGRASMIKKRTCHITVELSELSKKQDLKHAPVAQHTEDVKREGRALRQSAVKDKAVSKEAAARTKQTKEPKKTPPARKGKG